MAMDHLLGEMGSHIQVNSRTVSKMEREYTNGQREKYMTECGKMVTCMAKGYSQTKKAKVDKVYG